jgi:hypothetical protein
VKVEIEIGALVLHGFSPAERRAAGAAVKREMERRLAAPEKTAIPTRGITAARVDAGSFVMAPGSRAGTVGSETARVVCARLAMRTDPRGTD